MVPKNEKYECCVTESLTLRKKRCCLVGILTQANTNHCPTECCDRLEALSVALDLSPHLLEHIPMLFTLLESTKSTRRDGWTSRSNSIYLVHFGNPVTFSSVPTEGFLSARPPFGLPSMLETRLSHKLRCIFSSVSFDGSV